MLITNKYNLPEAFVKAIQNSRHNADGCLSATTLLKGTKEIILENRHFDEITVDASDEVWAVFGTAVHSILEHQEDEAFKEEAFSVDVLDYKVTGKVDRYDMKHETIEDWKTASVWKVIFQDFEDWKRQGLIYTWLLRQSGLNVRHIRFIALLKDHSNQKQRKELTIRSHKYTSTSLTLRKKSLQTLKRTSKKRCLTYHRTQKRRMTKLQSVHLLNAGQVLTSGR